uniref:EF-hand domain-containing protein n=1 Tax=Alexandrium andersonii TaxID=327968 RepID=A0A7S2DSQ3_9DINO|mmetsp:Transcript_58118/g.130690  ORF Transcript_58118/g.130690 Transcript_58118/m.130690 type:complete len:179 (+) Transcript_58118:52-588(+)
MAEGKSKGSAAKDPPGVPLPRNEKGGLLITEEELRVAWDFFDTSGKSKLTTFDVKKRLQTFYKDITTREVKFLLNNQPEITFEELYALLKDNQLTNFDPVKEAFKVYDPHGTGFIDMDVVKTFFKELGYGDISDEDAKIILETADGDKDGRIGLEDFRMMVPFGQPDEREDAGKPEQG